jgi:Tol biopolymer transport system component
MKRFAPVVLIAAAALAVPTAGAQAASPYNGPILVEKRTYIDTIKPDGTSRRTLARGRFGGADWSPDKSMILFREGKGCCDKALWVMRRDGRRKRQLVDGTLEQFGWAPHMRRVAYVKETPPELPVDTCVGIYLLHLRSSESRLLAELPGCKAPWALEWSPTGGAILFTAEDEADKEQIFVSDLEGDISQLTEGPAENLNPMWSPDGSRIAFESTRDHEGDDQSSICPRHTEIYIMDADGTDQSRLSRDNSSIECGPLWLPSGRRLVFSRQVDPSDEASRGQVWLMRASGKLLRRLTPKRVGRASLTDLSPDGRWALYMTLEWTGGVRDFRWFVYKVPTAGGKPKRVLGPMALSHPHDW